MMSNDRGRAKRKDRFVRNVYGSICMAASFCAFWALWEMAKASPEHAAMVAACVAVIALARADVVIRFGGGCRHDRQR